MCQGFSRISKAYMQGSEKYENISYAVCFLPAKQKIKIIHICSRWPCYDQTICFPQGIIGIIFGKNSGNRDTLG